jgi:pilus assembly protein CpaD
MKDIWRQPMHHVRNPITDRRAGPRLALRTALALGFAALVCGCNTDQQITGAPAVPADYRLRHPISITEKDHTLQLFIGANRGSLTPVQRGQVLAFGQTWKGQATGGVIIDLPLGSSNEGSSAQAVHEVESILAATGVPPRSIAVRNYHVSARVLATVRITYPVIAAQAGPCGLWPKDIGPSLNRDYFENQPDWNFGCATQRNLAAMVADPADLVQPRAETPAYAARRTTVIDKYVQGSPTSTSSGNFSPPVGKITDLGQ